MLSVISYFFYAFEINARASTVLGYVGAGGIGVTLIFVGNKFQALVGYPIPLKLSVSTVSLVIAVVIALLTVLISAIVPSKRATKVSAIEAIRQSKDINTKIKKVRTSKLVYKVFGLPGMLANKYYKRSRKKYRATIIGIERENLPIIKPGKEVIIRPGDLLWVLGSKRMVDELIKNDMLKNQA